MYERARERVSSARILIQGVRPRIKCALYPKTLLLLQMDHGACSSALMGTLVIHCPLQDDILLLPHKSVLPPFRINNTEVGREHVDAGHRGREYAGAAVICVADVEHGVGEDDHLVRKWVFVRRCVGIEGYHGFYNIE